MSILLDIMLDNRFIGQLRYPKRGFPKFVDGKWIEIYHPEDLEAFVLEKRPSLKGKNIKILPTNQRVL